MVDEIDILSKVIEAINEINNSRQLGNTYQYID
jgi:hypothetical protein